MSNTLIDVKNLTRTFVETGEDVHVLKGLDLTIRKGEFLSIMGHSGSGKSTLLQILGSLDRPTSGEVLFNEKNIFEYSEKELNAFRLKEVGFIFQFHHLLPEMTALENVLLPANLLNGGDKEAVERAKYLLETVGLSDRLKHLPQELSGGERQRTAVARALINQPSLILADEPTGNLDSTNSGKLRDLFMKLNVEFAQSFVVVTHDDTLAKAGSRLVGMEDGCLADV